MLNSVQIAGRLGHDPELRYVDTRDGAIPTTTISIACDRDRSPDASGQKEVDWLKVVCWRQNAEFVANYLCKGRLVAVSGRLQVRSFTGQDGVRRTVTEIVASNIYPMDSPQSRTQQQPVGMVSVPAPAHAPVPQVMVAAGYAEPEGEEFGDPFADDVG